MKKLLLIATTLSIIASCTKESELESSVGDVAASFESATITRATDGVWNIGDQIGIFAYDEAGAIYNSYENIPYVTIDGGSPASFTPTNTIIYYPAGGSTLSFIAYSPYQASADDGLYKVNLSAQSTTEEVALIDLIVANDGAQYSNTNTEASLQLDHKLAKLTMTLKAGDGLDASDLVGVEVKLTNIATAGTYDLKGDMFTPSTADQTITPRTIIADSEFEAIIFPYTVSTFSVEFYLPVTGKTYTWADNLTFTSGKDHAYTVTIAESKISVSSATLSGWGVNDSEDLVAEKVWDGTTIATSFGSGSGTSVTDPFIIANGEQLAFLAQEVNTGTTYSGYYFELSNNIDLNNKEWTPIGEDETNSFNGTFDGGGCTISGLYINATSDYQGLFGYVGNGDISYLTLNEPQVKGGNYTGAVCGYATSGSIKNCGVEEGSVSGVSYNSTVFAGGVVGYANSSISDCYNTGDVSGTSSSDSSDSFSEPLVYAGGVVGFANSTITDCYSTGDVSGTSSSSSSSSVYAGGVVGCAKSSITSCYNTGDVSGAASASVSIYVGGVVGFTNSTITECYNTGDASGSCSYDNSNVYIGGIVGYTAYATITKCYSIGDVSGTTTTTSSSGLYVYVGGIVGSAWFSSITFCYNTGDVSGSSSTVVYAGGVAGNIVSTSSVYSYLVSCYNTGAVNGASSTVYAGGVVSCYSDTITTCYFIDQANDSATDGVGDSTSSDYDYMILSSADELNSKISTMEGSDTSSGTYFMEDVSNINGGYPILSWQ